MILYVQGKTSRVIRLTYIYCLGTELSVVLTMYFNNVFLFQRSPIKFRSIIIRVEQNVLFNVVPLTKEATP